MRTLAALAVILALIAPAASTSGASKETKPKLGRTIVIETNKGTIEFGLYENDAPITSKNFAELVGKKFYDGLKFHRVEPRFVIQGGDPKGNGTGGSGKTIKLEVSPKLKHDAAGVVAMARSQHPDSASCQFYITLGPASFLDMNYAVFGRVTKGLDVAQKIEVGDVMKKVYFKPAPKPKKPAAKAPTKK
jgi:cyclophilin family peptidyl-prolyl cis-trans isomerase